MRNTAAVAFTLALTLAPGAVVMAAQDAVSPAPQAREANTAPEAREANAAPEAREANTAPQAGASNVEPQARDLEAQLVAPCCWSQQVSVHQSPAADSIRKDLRVRLARGESRQQILDDYVVQFGERILIEPPARGYKLLLYVFPPVALVLSGAGVAFLVRRFTRRRADAAVPPAPAAGTDRYAARLEDELRDLD